MAGQQINGDPQAMAKGASMLGAVASHMSDFSKQVGRWGLAATGEVQVSGQPGNPAGSACSQLSSALDRGNCCTIASCSHLSDVAVISATMWVQVGNGISGTAGGPAGTAGGPAGAGSALPRAAAASLNRAADAAGVAAPAAASSGLNGAGHYPVPAGDADTIITAGRQLCHLAATPDALQGQFQEGTRTALTRWASPVSADFAVASGQAAGWFGGLPVALPLWGNALIAYGQALKTAQKGFRALNAAASKPPAPMPPRTAAAIRGNLELTAWGQEQYRAQVQAQQNKAAELQAPLDQAAQKLTGACHNAQSELAAGLAAASRAATGSQQLLNGVQKDLLAEARGLDQQIKAFAGKLTALLPKIPDAVKPDQAENLMKQYETYNQQAIKTLTDLKGQLSLIGNSEKHLPEHERAGVDHELLAGQLQFAKVWLSEVEIATSENLIKFAAHSRSETKTYDRIKSQLTEIAGQMRDLQDQLPGGSREAQKDVSRQISAEEGPL